MEVTRKQRTPNFPKRKYLSPPDTHTDVRVLGGKKCLFFGNFGLLSFLATSFLRFANLPYYQQYYFFSGKVSYKVSGKVSWKFLLIILILTLL